MKKLFKVLIVTLVSLTLFVGCGSKSAQGTAEDWDKLQVALKASSETIPNAIDGNIKIDGSEEGQTIKLDIPFVAELQKDQFLFELTDGIDLSGILDAGEDLSELEQSSIKATTEMLKNKIIINMNKEKMVMYLGGEVFFDQEMDFDIDELKKQFEEQTGTSSKYEDVKDQIESFEVSESGGNTIYSVTMKAQDVKTDEDSVVGDTEFTSPILMTITVNDGKAKDMSVSSSMDSEVVGAGATMKFELKVNYGSDKKVELPSK